MKIGKYIYKEKQIRTREFPDNGILFNTKDICSILNINERPKGKVLSQPCLDLASTFNIAKSYNKDFAMWLIEKFAAFNNETLIHPKCNDDWDDI